MCYSVNSVAEVLKGIWMSNNCVQMKSGCPEALMEGYRRGSWGRCVGLASPDHRPLPSCPDSWGLNPSWPASLEHRAGVRRRARVITTMTPSMFTILAYSHWPTEWLTEHCTLLLSITLFWKNVNNVTTTRILKSATVTSSLLKKEQQD